MADQQEIQKIHQKVGTVINTERVAEKLSRETLRKHAEMSVEQTASNLSFIDQVFANREIVLDDNTKMRLKNARSRAEAHLLVNDHKRFKALSSDEFVTDKIIGAVNGVFYHMALKCENGTVTRAMLYTVLDAAVSKYPANTDVDIITESDKWEGLLELMIPGQRYDVIRLRSDILS